MQSVFCGYKVLIIQKDFLLLYRHCKIYSADLRKRNKPILIGAFSCGLIKKALSYVRIMVRFFRLEPRTAIAANDGTYLCSFSHRIWKIDINRHLIVPIFHGRDGWSTPLNLSADATGNIYWGDYGGNPNHSIVNIYKYSSNGLISVVYTFQENTIRHIHNVVFDANNHCFWILTGDNESLAGIYRADESWADVRPFLIGSQQYRSVIAFPYKQGLIYATDAVDELNFLYIVDANGIIEKIDINPISGSCIYGIEMAEYYIFATTVEPSQTKGLARWLSNKRGRGILDDNVRLLKVNKKTLEISEIGIWKKDWLPMRLFQYGSIHFPSGQANKSDLIFVPTACKGVDGKNLIISLK